MPASITQGTTTYRIDTPQTTYTFAIEAHSTYIGAAWFQSMWFNCVSSFAQHNAGTTIKLAEVDTKIVSDIDDPDWVVCCVSQTKTKAWPAFWAPQVPSNWLSMNLPQLGDLSLRQICLPYSHDVGISRLSAKIPPGFPTFKIQTQDLDIAGQLNAGARVFDLRPCLLKTMGLTPVVESDPALLPGTYLIAHNGSVDVVGDLGGLRQNLVDICQQIIAFASAHNELIILEISHCQTLQGINTFHDTIQSRFDQLFELINAQFRNAPGLLYRHPYPRADLTQVPLKDFFWSGKSAVVFTLCDGNISLGNYDGQGFYYGYLHTKTITDSKTQMLPQFYYTGSYANSGDINKVQKDQLEKLQENRKSLTDPCFLLERTATLASTEDALIRSIKTYANNVQPSLYQKLLSSCSSTSFPTLIGTDFYRQSVADFFLGTNALYGPVTHNHFGGEIEFALWNGQDVTYKLQHMYAEFYTRGGTAPFDIGSAAETLASGSRVSTGASLGVLFRRYSVGDPCEGTATKYYVTQPGVQMWLDPNDVSGNTPTSAKIRPGWVTKILAGVTNTHEFDGTWKSMVITPYAQTSMSETSTIVVNGFIPAGSKQAGKPISVQALTISYDPTQPLNNRVYRQWWVVPGATMTFID